MTARVVADARSRINWNMTKASGRERIPPESVVKLTLLCLAEVHSEGFLPIRLTDIGSTDGCAFCGDGGQSDNGDCIVNGVQERKGRGTQGDVMVTGIEQRLGGREIGP